MKKFLEKEEIDDEFLRIKEVLGCGYCIMRVPNPIGIPDDPFEMPSMIWRVIIVKSEYTKDFWEELFRIRNRIEIKNNIRTEIIAGNRNNIMVDLVPL